jgi:uncharacterized protein
MFTNSFTIGNIPVILWGEKSKKLLVAVHGNLSHKEDVIIQLLADEACKKGYQVLSFDLPEHGERKDDSTPCKVQFCVKDLAEIMNYSTEYWNELSLFACSMGAYFSLLAYKDKKLNQALFLSPVVDMERIIRNMMTWFVVTPERLQKEQTIETPIGQKLYWDYYCYVKEHPVDTWNVQTSILYGAKDEICEYDTISAFTEKFPCDLEIMKTGEHFFHTDEQLTTFSNWLQSHII